ncbi:MAG TPA: NAD(P)/FAD-dependent oxidoreductase [Ktedonobacteraceae bacterium]|nr:NAD(P)/FAD-dependent oxidoreductase [Ktedonobacteraceae bacterium]
MADNTPGDSSTQPRIAIVGAGIAGLNAALTLQDAGIACSIYEASGHIGGRMRSDTTTWADGMVTDLCGEFIDSDHDTLHALIRRFGLSTVDLGKATAPGAQNILYLFNRYYSPDQVYQGFETVGPILQQQIQECGLPTTYNHYTDTGYRLDHMSAYDWVQQYVTGGHDSPLGRMMNGACRGYFGLPTKEQSSLNLLYMFGSWIDEDEGEDEEDTPGSTGPMMGSIRIAGGNQQLPLAIARSLPEGCIHLNHRLVSIRRESDDSVMLSFTTPSGSLKVSCHHAILTLPFSTLREVDYSQAGFDALKQKAIQELGYGTISKLFLQFDTPYWYQQGPWPRNNSGFMITDLDIQVVWDVSLGQPGSTGILVDYTSGEIGASYRPPAPYSTTRDSQVIQQYARHCLEELEKFLPGISAHYTGVAALNYPTGDPFLRGSYACWRVGQYTRFAGYEGIRQGPIHFAGEHCSVKWQGFMEGGAEEGARAAREVLKGDLK